MGDGALGDRLSALRSDPARRQAAMVAGATVGLAVGTVHWIGFFLGGALVGLPAKTLRRALVAGLALGVVGWGAFVLVMAGEGLLGAYLSTWPVLALTVAVPVLGGAIGSLARGLV